MTPSPSAGAPADEKKQTVADFFTRASTIWEDNYTGQAADYRVHFFAQRRERVLAALGEPRGRTILDLGCASGDLSFALALAGARVVGVNLTKGMVHRAESRRRQPPAGQEEAAARAAFGIADAERLPFADAAFDAAACIGVMEYVPDDARGAAELFRVIRPGGRLVITAPHRGAPALQTELLLFNLAGLFKRRAPQAFHRNYTPTQMEERLTAAGFAIRSRRFISYLPYNVAMRLPNARGFDLALRRLFENGPLEKFGVTMIVAADRPGHGSTPA